MKTTYQTGLNGEQIAEQWLCQHCGMVCLERRFRSKAGEIDLILRDGETLVFAEVKTRIHASPGTGMLAVDRKKQQRIARAAFLYMLHTGRQNTACRFDVVEVHPGEVLHVPNAFQPGGMFFR